MHGVGGEIEVCWAGAEVALKGIDSVMDKCIAANKGKPPRPVIVKNGYEAVIRAIGHIQISAKGGEGRTSRILALFGKEGPRASALIPVGSAKLEAAGTTPGQARAMLEFSQKVLDGEIDPERWRSMTADDVVNELSQVNGIKAWTSNMVVLFHLKGPDVLLDTDRSLQRAVQKVYGLAKLPTSAEMVALFEKYRPYRSAAAWYIWKAAELDPGLHG